MSAGKYEITNKIRILFDEYHSESWSVAPGKAAAVQSARPDDACYSEAARLLREREFSIYTNHSRFDFDLLARYDILVLLHPCDPKWESTTSGNSPKLDTDEIAAVKRFIRQGGGLLIITDHENDKYGNNINDIIAEYGITVNNDTIYQPGHSLLQNATHARLDFSGKNELTINLNECYFLRCGSISTEDDTRAITVFPSARQPSACVVAKKEIDEGRIIVATDSDVFGNEYIDQFDHSKLWLNIFYWLSQTISKRAFNKSNPTDKTATHPAWLNIKSTITALREIQEKDGSVIPACIEQAENLVRELKKSIAKMAPLLPHQKEYFETLIQDLDKWGKDNYKEPDFLASLNVIHLEKTRDNETIHLVVFPIHTNRLSGHKFEAILYKAVFPEWLKQINDDQVNNSLFVSASLLDYTNGYSRECAVFFPEMVKVNERAPNHFGVIFSNREAKRCRIYTRKAIEYLHVIAPPDVSFYLNSSDVMQESFALWDLLHDKSHMEGFMPFDPFMVRKKSPFWMYSLEELRADLESYYKAMHLEASGFNYAHWTKRSILFDRVFRFPIAHKEIKKDFDGLAGQVLCAFLFKSKVLAFSNNTLSVQWNGIDAAILELRDQLTALYNTGLHTNRMKHWQNAHDFIAKYVEPHFNSKWAKDRRHTYSYATEKEWIDVVNDDEFPLNFFYQHLKPAIHSN